MHLRRDRISMESAKEMDLCLATGTTGRLLAACVDKASSRSDLESRVRELGAGLADSDLSCGLFSGLTGIAWVLENYVAPLGLADAEVVSDQIRTLALQEVQYTNQGDLIGGVAGIGLYSAMAGDAEELASAAMHRLITDDSLRAVLMEDLGIAHGVPGLLMAISSMIRVYPKLGTKSAQTLIDELCKYLITNVDPAAGNACGYRAGDGKEARLAWCYGDLSVAVSLLAVHELRPSNEKLVAIRLLCDRSLQRPLASWKLEDYGLCHGISGAALLLDRLSEHIASSEIPDSLSQAALNIHLDTTSQASAPILYDRNYGEGSLLGGRPGLSLWAQDADPGADRRWRALFLGLSES